MLSMALLPSLISLVKAKTPPVAVNAPLIAFLKKQV